VAGDDGGGITGAQDGNGTGYVAAGDLGLAPYSTSINVAYGTQTPTVTYVASINGQTVAATFTTDEGQIANIDSSTGILTPTGNVGGTVTVRATYQNLAVTATLVVNVLYTDNGASATETGGVGGNGGVGGEGPGGPVSATTKAVLDGTPTTDPGVTWLYPYDRTVWPRGLLAPLLQWSAPTGHNYDGVLIDLKEAAFEYKGYFAATATPFIHHPVPQPAWDALGYSNAGEPVVATLVFSSGAAAYGPITETWTIAQGFLKGTVYYQSYGTALATNSGVVGLNGQFFGAATLAIPSGATDPVLIAGDNTHCRVCHAVSADGSTLVTQENNPNPTPTEYYAYSPSDVVSLTNGNALTPITPPTGVADGRYEFPALYPDGTFLFSDGAKINGIEFTGDSQLFSVPSGLSLASTGIPQGLRAGTPVFSPDGAHVAFNYWGGPNADNKSLAMMDFDVTTHTFSNFQILWTPPANDAGTFQMADWPSFLPTNDGVIYEFQLADDANNDWGATRMGDGVPSIPAQGELWWVDNASKTATRLDNLNGLGYLPTLASTNHTDDTVLNYEPTVNVIPSGGYAWIVFTTRRLYGNVATRDPYESDPRNYDLSTSPTPKKLWVAAFDLNPTPGHDPSHPAFYLPGQELLAGNSRGYWVVDPCKPTGTTCLTGDECCGGYCRNVDGGSVCEDTPAACSNEYDKCTVAADCCAINGGLACIDGRCEISAPPGVK
jgi:hypothetical protein